MQKKRKSKTDSSCLIDKIKILRCKDTQANNIWNNIVKLSGIEPLI